MEKEIVGSTEEFEKFFYAYFMHFAHQSITSYDMKNFFLEYFSGKVDSEKLNSIEWDKWWKSEGDVLKKKKFDSKLSTKAIQLAER